jgi:hypothetical protein
MKYIKKCLEEGYLGGWYGWGEVGSASVDVVHLRGRCVE